MRQLRNYSWVPDRPDFRDYKLARIIPGGSQLPPSVDLRAHCSPVEDQGDLASCTSNALAGLIEFDQLAIHRPLVTASRLFIYYNERRIEGTVTSDSGATLRDGIKSLALYGVCPEVEWPYDVSRFTRRPSNRCYKDGLSRRISSYYRLNTLLDMKTALAPWSSFRVWLHRL